MSARSWSRRSSDEYPGVRSQSVQSLSPGVNVAGARRLLRYARACVYTESLHSLEPLLRSPSCAVNARFWLFMSAIRFGTPVVAWMSEYGRSPHSPIAYPLCSFACVLWDWPPQPEATAIVVVIAAASSEASAGTNSFRNTWISLVRPEVPATGTLGRSVIQIRALRPAYTASTRDLHRLVAENGQVRLLRDPGRVARRTAAPAGVYGAGRSAWRTPPSPFVLALRVRSRARLRLR